MSFPSEGLWCLTGLSPSLGIEEQLGNGILGVETDLDTPLGLQAEPKSFQHLLFVSSAHLLEILQFQPLLLRDLEKKSASMSLTQVSMWVQCSEGSSPFEQPQPALR